MLLTNQCKYQAIRLSCFLRRSIHHPCLHYFTENSWMCDCSLAGQISERQLQKKLRPWSRDMANGRRGCKRKWQRAGDSTLHWRTSSAWR